MNSESARVRPDAAALKELDALVRNLGDQLAGYRRRALVAEARSREVEGELEAVTRHREALAASVRTAEADAAALRTAVEALRTQVASLEAERLTVSDAQPVAAPASAGTTVPSDPAGLADENATLRARLSEGRARTQELMSRVRFLRQQLMHGAER